MLGFGAGYTDGFQAAQERAVLGIVFEPSIGDRDHDGIKDDEDDCPDEPEDYDGFQDTKADSPPGRYGCPDPDNDGDGIPDVRDKCPDQPENFDGKEDSDGCPEGHNGDRDGDGVLDSHDKCPDDPEDRDGFEDSDGCPDPDNDKDGVPDKIDKCPGRSGRQRRLRRRRWLPRSGQRQGRDPRRAGQVPERGRELQRHGGRRRLPRQRQRHHRATTSSSLQKILFKTGSAKALAGLCIPIVTEVAETLKHHPEFSRWSRCRATPTPRADEGYNLRLAIPRANAVVAALVKRRRLGDPPPRHGLRRVLLPVDPADTPGSAREKPPRGVQGGLDQRRPNRRRARLRSLEEQEDRRALVPGKDVRSQERTPSFPPAETKLGAGAPPYLVLPLPTEDVGPPRAWTSLPPVRMASKACLVGEAAAYV